jgi:hypothetical protein
MNKIFKKTGIVGVACLIALLLSTNPSIAWCFSTDHTRDSQQQIDDWPVTREPDNENQYDAVQTVDVYNGHGLQIEAFSRTGGNTEYNATVIDCSDHLDEYLIFHSLVSIYLYMGNGSPEMYEGSVGIYGQAALELQHKVGGDYIPVGGESGFHNTTEYKIKTNQTVLEYEYLHVWDDRTLEEIGDGEIYRLFIYSVGGWIDEEDDLHPDNSPVTCYEFYEIFISEPGK